MTETLWNADRSGWAVFSKARKPNGEPLYRYQLGRLFEPDLFHTKGLVAFVLLNSSTANHLDPDPTVRRCRGFAWDWGYQGCLNANLYGFISPYPSEVAGAEDPVGPENDAWLLKLRDMRIPIVVGWGAEPIAQRRVAAVVELLGPELFCLGTNATGSPRHPLFLPKDTKLEPWRMPA